MVKRLEFGQLMLTRREFDAWIVAMKASSLEIDELILHFNIPFQEEEAPPILVCNTEESTVGLKAYTLPSTPMPKTKATTEPARQPSSDRQTCIDNIMKVVSSKRLTDAEVRNLYHAVSEMVMNILCTDPVE